MIIKTQSENLTCVDLSKLLNLEVEQITSSPEGIGISVKATETDITSDHIAVIKEIYGGQSIELITEDIKDEDTTR